MRLIRSFTKIALLLDLKRLSLKELIKVSFDEFLINKI